MELKSKKKQIYMYVNKIKVLCLYKNKIKSEFN